MVYSHSPTKTHVSLCLAATGCFDPQRRDTEAAEAAGKLWDW